MPRVLITGGTGFIGSRLARQCSEAGDSVRILAQANTDAEEANLARLRELDFDVTIGSVADPATVRRAIADVEFVYHLAAAQHEAGKPDKHFYEVNVDGARHLLEAGVEAGVKRFVHGSTIGVYAADRGTVNNDTPTTPDNIYGETKLKAEQLVHDFQDRIPAAIVRISETYGPGDRRLLKLFRGIARGRYVHIGRGGNLHHPIYVDDLVNALRCAASVNDVPKQPVVAAGYEVLTTRQIVDAIAETMGVKPPRAQIPLWPLYAAAVVMETALRPFGITPPLHRRRMHFFIKSFQFDLTTARSLIGYEPQIPFSIGVRHTAEHYRREGLLDV